MKGYPYNNDIILTSQDIKKAIQEEKEVKVAEAEITKDKKKDDGVKTILGVITDVSDFQAKIEKAIDSQENPEVDAKLKELFKYLDSCYEDLFEIAKVGVRGRHRLLDEEAGAEEAVADEESDLDEEEAPEKIEITEEDIEEAVPLPEEPAPESMSKIKLTDKLEDPVAPTPPTIMSGSALTRI